jgi:hypothetical protein
MISRNWKIRNNSLDPRRGDMSRHPIGCLALVVLVGLVAVASCVLSGLR